MEEQVSKKQNSLLQLFKFANTTDRIMISIASLAAAAQGTINPIAVMTIGGLLTSIVNPNSGTTFGDELVTKAQIFAVLGGASCIATYISRALWLAVTERQVMAIRLAYMTNLLKQDMSWFDKLEGTSLASQLDGNAKSIKEGLGENFASICAFTGTLISVLIIALSADWTLTLVIIGLMPILIFGGALLVKHEHNHSNMEAKAFTTASALVEQALNGIRTVYAFTLEERFATEYYQRLRTVANLNINHAFHSGWKLGAFDCALFWIFGLAFWVAYIFVIDSRITGADAVVVLLSTMNMASSLMTLPKALSSVASAVGASEFIFKVINQNPVILATESSPVALTEKPIVGQVIFDDITFTYPSRPDVPILTGFSLRIEAGMTVAFVGGSGSGKSTTIGLLQRFYDPQFGKVLLDGNNLKQMDIRTVRTNIGVVGQEPVLFNMTIKQNILFGHEGAVSSSHFREVCRMAECDEFVSRLPLAYDTPIRGCVLSGGQKQRIAIARALLRKPRILILDEATSALDTKSERLVQKALERASEGRTTFIIAHRLSTVRNADLIVVMEKGSIVEQGSHEALLKANGIYTQLVLKQSMGSQKVTETTRLDANLEIAKYDEQPQGDCISPKHQKQETTFQLPSPSSIAEQIFKELQHTKVGVEIRPKDKHYTKRVLMLLKIERDLIWKGLIASGCVGLVFPGFALILGFTVGEITKPIGLISQQPFEGPSMWISFMVICGIFAFAGKWGQIHCFGRVNAALTCRIRIALAQNLLRQEIGFFDSKRNAPGILVSKLSSCEGVVLLITRVWGDLATLIFTAIYGIALSAAFAPNLTGILALMIPFIIGAAIWQNNSIAKYEQASQETLQQAMRIAMEFIREAKTLQTLCKEDEAVAQFAAFLERPYTMAIYNAAVISLASGVQKGCVMFSISLGLYAGYRLLLSGSIILSNIIVVILGMTVTMLSIGKTSTLAAAFTKGNLDSEMAFELIDRAPLIDTDLPGVNKADEFVASFEMKDLVFKYPTAEEPIFNGSFSLSALKGQSIALVGPSGCGKSTVIGLLERWYDASEGTVRVGGIPITQYQGKLGLRSQLSLVGQEPVLFDLSILENISWGAMGPVSFEEVVEAAIQADAHTFIQGLPDGYKTLVGDKGSRMSGGQKQRIAIARALIRKPKFLLLDEATSALDSSTELRIQVALERASIGRTTVTIAHRLSTIKNADMIAVVSGGKIVECGTHHVLLAQNGLYAALCNQQDH